MFSLRTMMFLSRLQKRWADWKEFRTDLRYMRERFFQVFLKESVVHDGKICIPYFNRSVPRAVDKFEKQLTRKGYRFEKHERYSGAYPFMDYEIQVD